MELILKTAPVNIPQAIENLEQLKSEIAPKMDFYSKLVVTEDSIKEAKKDKAALNRFRDAINEQRIAVKKQCLEPYNALEKQCKELEALIIAPIAAIDTQIKAFDEIEKKEKLTALQTAFHMTEHPEWLQFRSVCPEKWENKTAKTDKLIEQIQQNVDRINAELKEIGTMYANSPLLTAILDTYRRTLDKSETLAYAVTLERQHEEDQKRKAAEMKNRLEYRENALLSEENAIEVETESNTAAESTESIITGTFTVSCTRSQLISLRDYMIANKINFKIGG